MSQSGARARITMTDITNAGYCASGTKAWFWRKGLDFRDFLANGITAKKLLSTNDAMAERVVTAKRERKERERG